MDLNMLEEVEEEVKTEGKVEIVQQSTQEKETYNDGENIKSERVTSDEDDASNFTMPLPAVELHKKRSVSLSTKKSHVPCEVCGKEYTRSYIATHLRTHLGDEKAKNFSCKFTKSSSELIPNFPFELGDLCGLNFSVKPYIYSHMINIHCASKKWVCNICGKSYAKKNTWAGHLRNHSGEEGRIFKCTYQNCGKRFAQQNKLNVHLRIHNGVRPYVCVHCGRGFIHYTDHRRHVYGHVRFHHSYISTIILFLTLDWRATIPLCLSKLRPRVHQKVGTDSA